MSVFEIDNNYFDLSEEINCKNIKCYEDTKNRNIFNERAVDCKIFGNEKNREYYVNNPMTDYLAYDKWITNKCNPYTFKTNIKPTIDSMGFDCNKNNDFLIKANNKHTYRNGIKYNCKNNLYGTYHQVFNNIKEKGEINQYCEKEGKYKPIVSTMLGCKPIKNLAEYKSK